MVRGGHRIFIRNLISPRQVIGVNTAIRANAAGIGFAIPIDAAERAMRELSAGRSGTSPALITITITIATIRVARYVRTSRRKIPHSYLGISMSSLTPQTASQNNADPNSNVYLPEESGALVLAVGQARSRRDITPRSGGDRREFLRVSFF